MRKIIRTLMHFGTVLGILGLLVLPAAAADFDFQGNFIFDNDVVRFNFSVNAPSTVTIFSSSWLTGDPPQGFHPMLGIWDGAGNSIDFVSFGFEGIDFSNGVPYSHGDRDSYWTAPLNPGNYIATLTQYNNFPLGNLSQGFELASYPNFTFLQGFGGATQPYFNGDWDDNDPRTSFWQFHFLNVTQASVVPLPGTLILLSSGLIALLGLRRKKLN